jgi:glycosyltransferase involved in cell wall biosynthesis
VHRKIRILYTIPNFTTAGSGQAMVNIIDRLDRRRFEPTVVVRTAGGRLYDQLIDSGVEVIQAEFTVALSPLPTLPLRVWRARRPFRDRFDIWHSFNWAGEITEPLIAYSSGARSWMYTKKNMGFATKSWRVRSLLARRIAVQNDEMTRLFFDKPWFRHKVRYIPTGIDIEPWQEAAPDLSIRNALGIGPEDLMVTCAGNIQPGKNQMALVVALAHLAGAHVVLAGRVVDPAYAASIEARASELGVSDRVHLIGHVDDVPGLMKASDAFALLSHSEGSPIAMVEAMAIGLPVVCSSIPGIRERITDGVDGYLVDPGDHNALAQRLTELAGSAELRRRIGRSARQSTELRGRVETEAARYETVYLELEPST